MKVRCIISISNVKITYNWGAINSVFAWLWSYHFLRPSVRSVSEELKKLSATIHPPKAPQLYLWSSADTLTEASHILGTIEMQKRQGICCHSHDFQVSNHVSHFKQFPDEYLKLVKDFVTKIMEEKFNAPKR